MLWIVIGDFSLIDSDVVVELVVEPVVDGRSGFGGAVDVGSEGIFLMKILTGMAISLVKLMNVICGGIIVE